MDLKQIGHDLAPLRREFENHSPEAEFSNRVTQGLSLERHGAWGLKVRALESGRRRPRVLAYLPCAIEHLTFCVLSFLSSEMGLIMDTLQSISENDIRHMR